MRTVTFVPRTDDTPLPCTSQPDLYFAPAGNELPLQKAERVKAAARLCAACRPEERERCASWARSHREWGIWGGRTEDENGYTPLYRRPRAVHKKTALESC